MKEFPAKAVYVFSPALRWFHWTMFLCVTVLFCTGLYIGNPFYLGTQGVEPTYAVVFPLSMEMVRFVHFVAAFIFVAACILRVYGFLINKGDRLFPKVWTRLYWEGLRDTTLHYLLLKPHHLPYLRNSLARTGYLGVYFLFLIEIVTGFAMYANVAPNTMAARFFSGVLAFLPNEYWMHVVHHYIAWLIILFAITHVYMVVRAEFMEKEGEVSGMMSGYKYYTEDPLDLGDLK